MKPFNKSLTFSIGAVVILVECLVLTSLGLFYTDRFSHVMDTHLEETIQVPGTLMNRQLLRYESVEDRSVMMALVGEEFLSAMVVGADGRIYYASDPALVGESVFNIPSSITNQLTSTDNKPKLIRLHDEGSLISITPLIAYEDARPFFHVYIKTDTQELKARKGRVALLFILGSAICVILTSLAIIGYSRKHVIGPLRELKEGTDALRYGEQEMTVSINRKDEIGDLAAGFVAMNQAIKQKIQELEAANADIRENEQRMSAFIQAIPDLVFILDKDGRYEDIQTSNQELLVLDSDQLIGKHLQEVIPKNTADKFMRAIEKTLKTGEPQTIEYNLSVQTGTVWFEARTSRIGDDSQRTLWLVRDVTYRKQMEQRLTLAKEEAERVSIRLRELDETKSSLVSSASHELRTPLTSLLGFSQLILKNFSKHYWPLAKGDHKLLTKGAQIIENLNILIHEGNRLTRLITNVLDLNKIEQGFAEWNEDEINPADLARKAINSVSGQFHDNHGLELVSDIADDLPLITVDSDRMLQVLLNLLSNAAKFTTSGTVTLKAFSTPNNRLRFEVTDTGPGIALREQERIFDAFHQAGDTMPSDDKRRGAGLGLAICRDIIKHYHGNIWVESEPGHGATFIIELPLA